ncbi:MAG: Glu/Leu/Phe/Val dehydrogenase [Rhodospirillales bacterium]|nr:MAG: Glu/Leu/Phe/Val dehydrogenase [Rhodospirillales bacterium]
MSEPAFRFCDELGPKTILHCHEPAIGLKAILVVDNVAAGPAIGGVRMAPDVTLEECFRLARAMTFKNAAAGLAHGGGKSVIFADPAMEPAAKERLVRAFAAAIGPIEDYIAGPDMGTDEVAMAWVRDEIGRSVGLPREIGGIPLDEIGATGFGLVAAAEVAAGHAGLALDGARVAVQGFGSVGKHAARFFAEKGAILVGASDSRGAIHDPGGLDVAALIALKDEGGHVVDLPAGEKLAGDALIGVDCDIWVPAARPDVIRADNAAELRARLVVQGANIGVTEEAEALLAARGVLSVPDFISNAGGVICAAVEYHEGTEAQAFQTIDEKIRANTAEVLARADRDDILPREAAVDLAGERVRTAMGFRRWKA